MNWHDSLRRLTACVVAAHLGLATGSDVVSTNADSDEKLRRFMVQIRPQPTASQAGAQAVREAAVVTPARLQERAELLKTGEVALARLQQDTALQAFERAALILHAADTEMALVRAYMQGGEYRRALAFGAHTAGAHLDVVGGSALYAWLLYAGGQAAIAQKLLAEAQGRVPGNALVHAVQQQLQSGAPLATGALLTLPTRLAPYGDSRGVPAAARVVGSALLLHNGRQALVPLQSLAGLPLSGGMWLRNGLGQLTKARVVKRITPIGVALVQLETALPVPDNLWTAPRDAFPGSVGYAVEFAAATDAAPAWPMLRTGFLGGLQDGGPSGRPTRLLGIDMPGGSMVGPKRGLRGLRGGPVFDAGGRLVGLALPGKPGLPDRLMLASQLPEDLQQSLGPPPPAGTEQRASVDRVYETSLKAALQLIAVPAGPANPLR